MRFHAFICQVLKKGWIPYNVSANKITRYPKMQSQYKIAVIDENNEIIKIYTKKEYDEFIIKGYKKHQPVVESLSIPNESTVYNESAPAKTNTVTVEPTEIAGKMLQENFVKPFQGFAVMLVLILIAITLGSIVYKQKSGRRPSKEALNLFWAIGVIAAFYFLFLK